MFININLDETYSVIDELYDLLVATSKMPAHIFITCLQLYTKTATFFAYNWSIYKEKKGLAMGNKLAQVIAEIKTNYSLMNH